MGRRAAAIPRKTITAGTVRENGSWEEASALTHGGQRPWRLRRGALDLPLTATRVPSPGPCTPRASPPMCLRAAMKRRRASAPHRAEPIKCHTVPCAEELSPRNGSRGWLDNDGGRRRQRPPVARGASAGQRRGRGVGQRSAFVTRPPTAPAAALGNTPSARHACAPLSVFTTRNARAWPAVAAFPGPEALTWR